MTSAPATTPTDAAPGPGLTRLDLPDGVSTPRAVVLVLHGGTQVSTAPVAGRSASWRRAAALQRAVTPALHDQGVATWLLRYRVRGWNGGGDSVPDARWALGQVREAHGEVPVVLLGHSMGARTAVHVADAPHVAGVVGLAPWWDPASDPVRTLAGRHLRAAHGRTDKITSARMTRRYVAAAEPVADSAAFTDMGRVGHYLLRRVERWNAYARDSVLEVLEAARV
ncbi:alpha/beta hydrolase [Nocardioides nanhaiensis]|uniref:Alpha/beta hydrolase n=1 Tax=Nocardioides nanhaiensis TaxID=1476871 RepID=A0ABP8W4C8_9ACTN